VTVVTYMSPTRHFITPLLAFPRKYRKQELINYTAPRSIHACHLSWWIQSKIIFFPVVSSFHQTNKADKRRSCYLVLDGHYSRTRNLEVIMLARENHVDVICLPPHSSHKMQPLDKALMGPPENILRPRNWKTAPFTPRASRRRLPNWRTIRKYKQPSCFRQDSG
jgi:hypothetical protein